MYYREPIFPQTVKPVYLVKNIFRPIGGVDLNKKQPNHVSRSKISRRHKFPELVILESRATLDPPINKNRASCRYYSVKGSGRDWDYDELIHSKEYAYAWLNYYRSW
jgi:hypothetical protein